MSGSGAWITSNSTNRGRKWIREVQVRVASEHIAVAAGNRVLPVCAQRREARMRPITPVTIWAFELFANAKNNQSGERLANSSRSRSDINEKRGLRRVSKSTSQVDKNQGLKRNLVRPRLALALAFRRLFCEGVSKARRRRTSSR